MATVSSDATSRGTFVESGEQVLICDLDKGNSPIYDNARFMHVDITSPALVAQVPIAPDDIVYNVAARMLHPIVKRRDRYKYFYSVDYDGAVNVIEAMTRAGCDRPRSSSVPTWSMAWLKPSHLCASITRAFRSASTRPARRRSRIIA